MHAAQPFQALLYVFCNLSKLPIHQQQLQQNQACQQQQTVCRLRLHCIAGYIGEFEYVDDHRGGKIVVELNGRSDQQLPVVQDASDSALQ